jgi:pyruvate dehydrogenase complex dehydrogenase (E1) component
LHNPFTSWGQLQELKVMIRPRAGSWQDDTRATRGGTSGPDRPRAEAREALRAFFELYRRHLALAALDALARDGAVRRELLHDALRCYQISPETPAPFAC